MMNEYNGTLENTVMEFKNEYLGKLEDIMPTLPSKSVRLIFADFPYNTTKV